MNKSWPSSQNPDQSGDSEWCYPAYWLWCQPGLPGFIGSGPLLGMDWGESPAHLKRHLARAPLFISVSQQQCLQQAACVCKLDFLRLYLAVRTLGSVQLLQWEGTAVSPGLASSGGCMSQNCCCWTTKKKKKVNIKSTKGDECLLLAHQKTVYLALLHEFPTILPLFSVL